MSEYKNAVSILEEYFMNGRVTEKVTYGGFVNITPNQGTAKYKCTATYDNKKFMGFGPDKKAAKAAAAENILKHVNDLMNKKFPPKKQAPPSDDRQRQDFKYESRKNTPSLSNKNFSAQNSYEQGEYFNPHAAEDYDQEQWNAPVDFAQSGMYYPEDYFKMPIFVYVYGPDVGPMDAITRSEPQKQLNVLGVTADQRLVDTYKTIIWRVVPASAARETFCALVVNQMNHWQFPARHIVQASPETLAILGNVCSALCFCGFEGAPIGVKKE